MGGRGYFHRGIAPVLNHTPPPPRVPDSFGVSRWGWGCLRSVAGGEVDFLARGEDGSANAAERSDFMAERPTLGVLLKKLKKKGGEGAGAGVSPAW